MLCVNCPFSLLCYAGRLDAEGGGVSLCIKCGDLTVLSDGTTYQLKCERRPLLREYVKRYQQSRAEEQKRYPQRKHIAAIQLEDPGPGLSEKLVLHCCVRCTTNATIKRLMGTVVQLDELAKAKEERGQHAFELAGSVSRKT